MLVKAILICSVETARLNTGFLRVFIPAKEYRILNKEY